jgi:hypothetical protein
MRGRSWNWPTDYRLTEYERDMLSGPDGVGSLGLSVRAFNCLVPPGATPRNWHILTIGQLCEFTPRLLLRRRGLGCNVWRRSSWHWPAVGGS